MALGPPIRSLDRLWRYYQAGIVNTLFGYGLYAVFVRLGLNMFLAQFVAHVSGVVFNYFTYSRYAFRDTSASKWRFGLSYAINYLIGAGLLLACHWLIPSPYLSMAVAVVFATAINYLILNRLVFTTAAQV